MPVHRVLPSAELSIGDMLSVVAEDEPILIARLDDGLHAVRDVCAHVGARLSEGLLRDGCVTCPAHLWRFRLADGCRIGNEAVTIPRYPVWDAPDGWIEVDIPERKPAMSLREALLAHAREPRDLD